MYLFFTDEAGTNEKQGEFFVYGGVAVPHETAPALHDAIGSIRQQYGFADDRPLKFTPSKSGVSFDVHREAKKAVLAAAAEASAVLFAVVVHHGISKKDQPRRRFEYNANWLLRSFHRFLDEKKSYGIVYIDRVEGAGDPFRYLREKHQRGLIDTKTGATMNQLCRIHAYGLTCDGASHLASVNDIAIGTLRYLIGEQPLEGGEEKLAQVMKLCWRGRDGRITDRGVLFVPKRPLTMYAGAYSACRDYLNGLSSRLGPSP